MQLRILIGCERSRVVAKAFEALGHKVLSCDLESARQDGPHYQGNVFDVIDYPWDLAIFHFPCTNTSVSGAAHFASKWNDGRQAASVSLFMHGWRRAAHIPHVSFEHPVSILSSLFRKPDQIIQPYEYGHDASKSTCLWLRGLPRLIPTCRIEPRFVDGKPRWGNQTDSGQNKLTPSDERAELRSETYAGVAAAMADQYTRHILSLREQAE